MQTTTIDMLTPVETCQRLRVDEPALIDLVNNGELAAYRFGGHIRFRTLDVDARCRLVAA